MNNLNDEITILDIVDKTNELSTAIESDVVNSDLSNISATGKSNIIANAFPSTKYISITSKPGSGDKVTAPADGWYNIEVNTNDEGGFTMLRNETRKIGSSVYIPPQHFGFGPINIPVRAGDQVKVQYTGQISKFYFIYAEGNK